jgi:uncharacterized protein
MALPADSTHGPSWQTIVGRFRTEVEAAYGENLDQIVLYGSRARGDWEAESDIDLLVVLKQIKDFWADVRMLEAIAYNTTFGSGVPIVLSVIPIRTEEFMMPATPFVSNLRREGVLV